MKKSTKFMRMYDSLPEEGQNLVYFAMRMIAATYHIQADEESKNQEETSEAVTTNDCEE